MAQIRMEKRLLPPHDEIKPLISARLMPLIQGLKEEMRTEYEKEYEVDAATGEVIRIASKVIFEAATSLMTERIQENANAPIITVKEFMDLHEYMEVAMRSPVAQTEAFRDAFLGANIGSYLYVTAFMGRFIAPRRNAYEECAYWLNGLHHYGIECGKSPDAIMQDKQMRLELARVLYTRDEFLALSRSFVDSLDKELCAFDGESPEQHAHLKAVMEASCHVGVSEVYGIRPQAS